MAAKGELKAVAGVVVADPLATHGDIRAPSIKAVLAAAALTLGGVEEVGAIMGVEEQAMAAVLWAEEAGDLAMSAAARALEVPRCFKAPRGPAPVQCCPRRPLSLAMYLGWAWAQRGRTRRLCL